MRASMRQGSVASSYNDQTRIYEFADPAFKRFLLRKRGFGDIISNTTTLTPVDYIFHGPNTGAPLFEGKDRGNNYYAESNISILLKQPGDTVGRLVKTHAGDTITAEITKKPDTLIRLFNTVAFAGAFEKSRSGLGLVKQLDMHENNVLFDIKDGSLGLIDQMSIEDIAGHAHTKLNFDKAYNSVEGLRRVLGANIRNNAGLVNSAAAETLAILSAAEKQPDLNAQLAYLQTHLSDPGTEKWRGVEPVFHVDTYNEALDKPVFGGVTKTTAVALDMKKATPQQLLDGLNEMADKTLAKSR